MSTHTPTHTLAHAESTPPVPVAEARPPHCGGRGAGKKKRERLHNLRTKNEEKRWNCGDGRGASRRTRQAGERRSLTNRKAKTLVE